MKDKLLFNIFYVFIIYKKYIAKVAKIKFSLNIQMNKDYWLIFIRIVSIFKLLIWV